MGNLTAKRVETLGEGVHADGDRLHLQVKGATGRSWVFRYKGGELDAKRRQARADGMRSASALPQEPPAGWVCAAVGRSPACGSPTRRPTSGATGAAEATTTFGTEGVPLIEQATRLEFAGGVITARLGPRFSVFAQGGYQYAADESGPNAYRRDSVKGDLGVRYAW